MIKILDIKAREIFDSRGNPTVENRKNLYESNCNWG